MIQTGMSDAQEAESNEHSKRNTAGGWRVTGRQDVSCWTSEGRRSGHTWRFVM